jgi:hypothetical protein
MEGSVAAASAEGVGLGVSLTVHETDSGDKSAAHRSIDVPKGRSTYVIKRSVISRILDYVTHLSSIVSKSPRGKKRLACIAYETSRNKD